MVDNRADTRVSMRTPLALILAGTLLSGAPLLAQDAQSRLWDAAIAGDTLAIRQAVADGAKVDSLDVRRNPNGRLALNWAAWANSRTSTNQTLP